MYPRSRKSRIARKICSVRCLFGLGVVSLVTTLLACSARRGRYAAMHVSPGIVGTCRQVTEVAPGATEREDDPKNGAGG